MKKCLFITALALLLMVIGCTKSKTLFSLAGMETMSPVSEAPIDLAAYEAKYGEYDGVFLRYEQVIEHAGGKEVGFMAAMFNVPSSWDYQRIFRSKYIVFNTRADWLTSFDIWAKPDSLYMRITNPDGSTREYGVEDLREEKGEYGDRDYRFIFPDVQRGSIIDIGYRVGFKVGGVAFPPLEHTISLQHSIPTEEVLFTYACPDWWQYQVKKNRLNIWPHASMETDPETRKSLIRVSRKDVPAVKVEKYGPYFKDMADYLQFRVTKLEMAGSKFEANETWEEVGEHIRKNALKKLDNVSPRIKQRVDLVTDASGDQMALVRNLLEFARDSIELDGKNRHGNPDRVLKDRKADIFDLTAMVSGVLDRAGMPNDYLLVHSALEGYCDMAYISGRQFYTPAIQCRIDSADYVLFPYMSDLPIGVIPPWFIGQPAMAIEKSSVRLVNLPKNNQIPSSINESYELAISEDGLIKVSEERTLSGAQAYLMRDKLSDLSQTDLEEVLQEMLTYTDGDVNLTGYDVHELDDPYQPLRITYEYTIDNLCTVTPEEVLFQTTGLFSPISGAKLIDDPEQRINEVVIDYTEAYDKIVRIKYPEAWTLTTSLQDVAGANDFGEISGKYELSDGLVSADQSLRLNRIRKPREAYAEFLQIAGRQSDLEIPTLVFTLGAPEPVEASSGEAASE